MKPDRNGLLGSREEATLLRIAGLHAVFVALSAAALPAHAIGVVLGGAAIGGATAAFWVIGRGLLEARRSWIVAASVTKVLAYLLLVGAAFSGAVRIDALGFAIGVTAFPVAVVAGTLYASASRWRTVS